MKQKHIIPRASSGETFYDNERGIILIIVIAFVAIIALVGTVAVITISTDIKISSNYRSSKKSFYNAKAGIEEAKARLRGQVPGSGDPNENQYYAGDETDDPDWCAYILTSDISGNMATIDPDYAGFTIAYPITGDHDNSFAGNMAFGTNTRQLDPPNMSYWVRIRHKREWDAEEAGHNFVGGAHHYQDYPAEPWYDGSNATHTKAARGNIIYYGFPDDTYSSPVQFTTVGVPGKFRPVEIIESYGDSAGSTNTIREEVVVNPGIPLLGAIYSKEKVELKGAALEVDGVDDNASCNPTSPDVPSVYGLLFPPEDHTGGTGKGKGGGTPLVNPPYPTNGGDPTVDVTIENYINILKRGEIEIIDKLGNLESGLTWAGPPPISSSTNYQTFYSNAVPFTNSLLTLTSNESGYGVLLVEGNLKLSGGFEWNGLIVCTGSVELNGGGGGVTVEGAIIGNNVKTAVGNVDVQFNSCYVNNALYAGAMNEILWKEDY